MKTILMTVLMFSIATQYGFSQIQSGFWQGKTPDITDAYLGGYNFTDSTFEYTINGYDGLNPITAFGGTYHIKDGKILFAVTYIKKIIGGQLCRSLTSTLNDSWSIEDGMIIIEKLNPVVNANATIEILMDYLLIDKKEFYKVKVE